MVNHSALPWEVGFANVIQARSENDPTQSVQIVAKVSVGHGPIKASDNAAFIVHAANNIGRHEQFEKNLLEILKLEPAFVRAKLVAEIEAFAEESQAIAKAEEK